MKKQKTNTPAQDNIWDTTDEVKETVQKSIEQEIPDIKTATKPKAPQAVIHAEFDIEGLMTDFPTAKDLERFVYDETGIVLNLKGRANKLKYQVAMDALNGVEISEAYIGTENPYIDKAELIPTEELKKVPERSSDLPPRSRQQNAFFSPIIPHPDADQRAQDKKVSMMFRKYDNGMISYEILGPLETQPFGEKIDKYGRTRPEIIKWIDPRTGEQTIMREDGTLTPQGKRLRAMMQTFKVNKSNQWEVWIDREFVSLNDAVAHNPWDLRS
jgi:hypothetical protein